MLRMDLDGGMTMGNLLKRSGRVVELYVSPQGDDAWSGTLAGPNGRRTDGPYATFAAAQQAVRRLRHAKGFRQVVRIVLRGGVHFLKAPIRLRPEDSGIPCRGNMTRAADDPVCPLIVAAYPGETPVLSGGRRITGWREETVNGKAAWTASIPSVKRGAWNFRQLWVNGERRYRTRLPRQGRYRIDGVPWRLTLRDTPYDAGNDRFRFAPGDLRATWRNLNDVEIVFPNFWIDQRLHIRRLDARRRLVVLDRRTHTRLIDESWADGVELRSCLGFYQVENVFEALEEPGDWYLDRVEGKLHYLPMLGEDIRTAEVVVPCLEHILRVEGDSLDKAPAQEIRFEGITFAHTEWTLPDDHAAAGIQAACDVTGAVAIRNARTIDFEGCTFVHVGGYALECAEATRDIGLVRCEVRDTGAGGVKIWHGCHRTTISDCRIHDGGRVHASGVGILIGRASGNRILHNEVCDFGYSGISVGWDWSAGEGGAYGNVIEHNHIHHIGRGELSDLGGIYTLGVAPGTRIRHNRIHDVRCRTDKAWGIYLDACSSLVLIENNVVFRTNDGVLNMNQNRGHEIRNNIFALGDDYQLRRATLVAFPSCVFERNIVYSAGGPFWTGDWKEARADLRGNLYFAADGKRAVFSGRSFRHWRKLGPDGRFGWAPSPLWSLRQWQKRGLDAGSLVADPKFRDPERGDFRLAGDSPALQIGFVPFDLADVGPRSASVDHE
ncbi:MAG: right-handed parallel beta-helix repeat-containing protein [Kiritimatiellae bacterium]|nr:right-handed parallel beta-helix repeat-containing protein [Kiritimatiellia bacterium]